MGLNPYCSGRWSRTSTTANNSNFVETGLNPYCSGRWSHTWLRSFCSFYPTIVLILIVVDDGLVLSEECRRKKLDKS